LHQRIGTVNSCRCRIPDECQDAPEARIVRISCPAGLAVHAARIAVPHEAPLFLVAGHVLPLRHAKDDLRRLCERLARLLKAWNGNAVADAAMLAGLVEQVPEAQVRAQLVLLQLFATALQDRVGVLCPPSRLHGHSEAVRRALAFIEAHYTTDIRLRDAARACSMSPSHFSRTFHKETGSTYHQYLQTRRVDSFKQRLADPDITIAEAAHGAGFQSISRANRTFRDALGCTPSAYRFQRSAGNA
jgi:AraC-like DNA-binding protein